MNSVVNFLSEAYTEESSTIDFAKDEEFHQLIYGNPTETELIEFNRLLNRWKKDIYTPKFVKLYHGTAADHDIENEGLKRTSRKTQRSLQSGSGFVYLTIFPSAAKRFAQFAYPGKDVVVYEVRLPIYKLSVDKDQLKNQRMFAGRNVKDDLAHSIVYGHGVAIKDDVKYGVKKFAEYKAGE
jgi:hypothetical protein